SRCFGMPSTAAQRCTWRFSPCFLLVHVAYTQYAWRISAEEHSRLHVKHLAEIFGLLQADITFTAKRFADMAPLAEYWQQIGRGPARVLQEELQHLCRRAIVFRHCMTLVIISEQGCEKPVELGFGLCTLLTHQFAKARTHRIILLFSIDVLR